MNGNISKRKGLVSSVDTDSLNYISEKVSEKLTGYTAAVALEEAARTEADKALESEILKKQDKLTFDTAPTAESENPLTSGVIKDELDKKVDKADGKVLSSNDFTDEDKAKLDKKVDKADGMGLSKIKDISLEKMTIASSPGGVLAKCEMLDIETQSGEKISASYVPETHLMEFGHPNKCVTKSKLSDELQAEMDKISTKADKSDTYTKTEVDNKVSSAQKSCVKNTDYATTSKAGIVKISDGLKVSSGLVSIDPATENDVKQNMDSHKPFAPSNIELLLKLVTTDTINSNNDLAPTSQAVKAALSLYATKEDTDEEISEINKTLALKINKYDIVDALMNTSPDKVLSANQGAVLKGLIADKADKSDTYTKDEIDTKITNAITTTLNMEV